MREEKRHSRQSAFMQAADAKARAALKKNADSDSTLGKPTDAVAFTKLIQDDGTEYYVGQHAITDSKRQVKVFAWKAPLIMRMREATAENPSNVRSRRDFTTAINENRIINIDDVVFAELASRIASLDDPALAVIEGDELLQEALGRGRTPELQQIVQTIQAAQSKLIRTPLERLLVIQGGPGTGKTAVALHRVSYLLFTYSDQLDPRDVLVVGPNPTFTRYIRQVLPELGDENVNQTDLQGMLSVTVSVTRKEEPAVAKLKGDGRMDELILNGLRNRVRRPADDTRFTVTGRTWAVSISPEDVDDLVENLLPLNYNNGRARFRTALMSRLGVLVRRGFDNDGTRLGRDPQELLRAADIENFVERVWPRLTPPQFLSELFGSLERLVAAAPRAFGSEEIQLLRRQSASRISEESWSKEDLVLLDAVQSEMSGATETYHHIVVDEAQDLTPMQLKAIANRSSGGSMTVVGDIAQSTGNWARNSWDDVVDELERKYEAEIVELSHGYRVPRSVMDLAADVLTQAAPGITPPVVVRDVAPGPQFRSVDLEEDFDAAVLEVVKAHSGVGRFVGVICPDSRRQDLEELLDREGVKWNDADRGGLSQSINVVSPVAAKGLEFDAIVIADPERIIEAGPEGFRMLYIAVTRTTHYLNIVHPAGHLPEVLGGTSQPVTESVAVPITGELDLDDDGPSAERSINGNGSIDDVSISSPEHSLPVTADDTRPAPTDSFSDVAAGDRASRRARTIDRHAEDVLDDLKDTVAPHLWRAVLERALEQMRSEP
ncbi:HelD family protein [Georgenia muralis]|uniref:HelD family protein n=1 Tax=Georgenia muralis TaxID=154117 RepID=UPI000F50E463|nr:UvrD-helicase domain-containing protein [Georgenia muralis]